MKPQILVSMTAAQSPWLDSSGATLEEIAQRGRWFTPGTGGKDGRVRWSAPRGDRSTERPKWTLAECAQACSGLPDRIHLALRFSFARDDAALWDLRRYLLAFAESRQRIERWPKTIRTLSGEGKPYLQQLVDISLMDERRPSRFIRGETKTNGRPPNIRPILMDVNRDVWRRQLEKPYEALIQEYQIWLGIGAAHMGRRLKEEK